MTRQRMRPSLKRSVYFDCPHCKGAGLVKTAESMSLDAMRRVAIAINDLKVARVEMTINPEVNFYLQNKKRRQIADLEERHRKRVLVRSDPRDVAAIVGLARATYRKIVQNLWWATGYNAVAVPLAAGVLYPATGVLLSPALGAVFMSVSTVIVAVNAQLLGRRKPTASVAI